MDVGDIDAVIVILEDLDDRLTAAVDHLDEDGQDTFIAYVSGLLTTCKVAVAIALKASKRFHKEKGTDLAVILRSRE